MIKMNKEDQDLYKERINEGSDLADEITKLFDGKPVFAAALALAVMVRTTMEEFPKEMKLATKLVADVITDEEAE